MEVAEKILNAFMNFITEGKKRGNNWNTSMTTMMKFRVYQKYNFTLLRSTFLEVYKISDQNQRNVSQILEDRDYKLILR